VEYRTLGTTGLKVSAMGFGTIKLPAVSQEDADEALNLALDMGVNYVDTARDYDDSETKVGRAIGHRRADFYLATKTYERTADGLREELETSLRELRTDRIDVFQLHSVSNDDAWEQVMRKGGALEGARKAQAEGIVGHVGVSIHRDLVVMKRVIDCGEFETVMLCYNAIDNEHVEPDILPAAHASGMGVLCMKALSGGMIVSPGFEDGRRPADEDALVSKALRFVLGSPHLSVVLVGMRNPGEVRQNVPLADATKPLSEDERGDLIRHLGEMRASYRYGQVCLQCGYCQPCPAGINIPQVLRAWMIKQSYPDDLKRMADEIWNGLEVLPDKCEKCGTCLRKCPAGLDIPNLIREAAEVLGAPVE